MTTRYAKLTDDWLMRGWQDLPFAVVNWKKGDIRPFSTRLEMAARACDGQTDFNSPLLFPAHRKILDKLIEEGIAEECGFGRENEIVQDFRKAPNPYLARIHWSVTGKCNLNCRHCYMEAPGSRYCDMDTDGLFRIIDQFESANVLSVSLTGGEPFVRKDLFALVQRLLDKRIAIPQIYTNGLLVTGRVLEEITNLGMTPTFCLSFDGVGAHDDMRGIRGVEEQAVEAIRRIRMAGFEVNIATAVDKNNREAVYATYRLVKELGIKSWQIAPPNRTGNWAVSHSAVTIEEETALYEKILQKWYEDGTPFELQLGAFFNSRVDRVGENKTVSERRHTKESYACGVCRQSLYLLPDGGLLPCHGVTGTDIAQEMPNLRETDLSLILTGSKLMDFVNTRKSDLLKHNPECAGCESFDECGMGCRALAFIEGGSILLKDPVSCRVFSKGYRRKLLQSIQEKMSL